MAHYEFLVPAGLDINQNIQFPPKSVVVYNYSPFYIYLPDGLAFVSPWTGGAIIPLSHATQARATWKTTPFGPQILVIPADVSYSASFSFYDIDQAAGAGTTILNPYNRLQFADFEFDNVVANQYSIATFTAGQLQTIDHILVSAKLAAAGLGTIAILLSDGTTVIDLMPMLVDGVDIVAEIRYLTAFVPILDPSVGWTITALLTDIVGPCNYYIKGSVAYR